ncbi:uncharacterized protein K02A2.6-like [Toxorhynchites rutilus septentrionalis]|uniref:uncharacterized protein K02A2.6-like n=1 Tax=Toxorhynchites rutilus septentrionalis TaxID=329112 RepID=UPI00247ADBB2|nr:uncharacterized protein K02A2.6-like [Toxorhynchites rutilus septentrionalis]
MPETVVSDNGTQLTSLEFAQFCSTNGIDHVTIAPFHPQSNGQVERFVDTFKRAMKKLEEGRESTIEALETFLLAYRSTPNRSAPEGLSPSEIMFGRRIRTCLELLRPPTERPPSVTQPVNQKKFNIRFFNVSDPVYVKIYTKNVWNWVPGKIIEKVGRVMFNVLTENRRLVRSHLNQLKSRASSGFDHVPEVSTSPRQKQLPLNVLLDAWNISPISDSSSEVTATTANASDVVRTPSLSPPAGPGMNADLSSSSSSTTSSSFESAAASTPTIQHIIPRRSSRQRRPPVIFNL